MKVTSIILTCLSAIYFSMAASEAAAQAAGSSSSYGGSASVKNIVSGGISTDVSESLYIGPGEHIIDGTWDVYARNVIIDPAAVITGGGIINFYNPSVAGGAASATFLDANNMSDSIAVNIALHNSSGLRLRNMPFPADHTTNGWTNNATASTVYLGKDLDLAADGADVFLDTAVTGDLRLGQPATLSNYSAQRMVVTNNRLISHMVKAQADVTAFVYPVGIADGDYTPATINGPGIRHISVQDYTPAMPVINYADSGMNRTWHIYNTGNTAATTLTLQHNLSTNGAAYQDAAAFITQQLSPGTWSVAPMPDYVSPGVHSNASIVIPDTTNAQAFFSKRVSQNEPLPVTLASFKAQPQNCDVEVNWQTKSEKGLEAYELQHSSNGNNYALLYSVAPRGGDAAYRYVHKAAGNGTHFYRLKITDIGGAFRYSPIATTNVTCSNNLTIKAYPNPAYDRLVVDGMGAGKSYTLRLVSIDGKVVLQRTSSDAGRVELDISSLAPAMYYLQVEGNEAQERANVKITKM